MPGWHLQMVISGGQTGADQAGISAARFLDYATGGRAPKGFLTEEGLAGWLADFGLHASPVESYKSRTYHNVIHADGTLIFSPVVLLPRARVDKKHRKDAAAAVTAGGYTRDQLFTSYGLVAGTGSRYTAELAIAHRKHLLINPGVPAQVREWIYATGIHVLNVAGTRESRAPGMYDWVYEYLIDALVPF